MKPIRRYRFPSALALVSLALSCPPAASQNIACSCTKKRFDLPRKCFDECNCVPAIPKGNPVVARCLVAPKPECAVLDDLGFRQVYNRALFNFGNVGPVVRLPANTVLVARVINSWFAPNNITQFDVVWAKPEDVSEEWADVTPAPSGGKKATLTIAPDALWLSPAGLVVTLGHEMVHVEQLKRSYTVRMNGLNGALTSFRELEASSWELGARDFKWEIGANKWSACVTDDEKKAAKMTFDCRDWQVRKAIEDVRTGPRNEQFVPALEKFMGQDPWISQVWLKQHPDWKTLKVGPAPQECPNP